MPLNTNTVFPKHGKISEDQKEKWRRKNPTDWYKGKHLKDSSTEKINMWCMENFERQNVLFFIGFKLTIYNAVLLSL